MAAFNKPTTKPRITSQVSTTGPATTALGASGFSRSPLSDLYLLSVSNLVTADMFHEGADPRNERYVDLLRSTALLEQGHVTRMLPWLRQDGYMRSASILGAAEAAKVLCDQHRYDGVEDMIDGVLQRADEPGEFLAYWFSIAGKAWPKRYLVVKRGLKRAVSRLYNEYSYGKWDSSKRSYRFADVIDIVHPAPKDQAQSDLFRYILDRRHGRRGVVTDGMSMLQNLRQWRTAAANLGSGGSADRVALSALLDPSNLKGAGLTWEDVLSELGGKVDKKVLWESVIPVMAPGALIKNLRNFDEVGISSEAADRVAKVLSDAERVRKAKLFPFRFLSAYKAVPSLRWGHALEQGLAGSLELVPRLRGKTLFLVDRSPSMFPGHHFSTPNKSDVTLADQAALFGAALAVKAESATLVEFGGTSRQVRVPRGASVLKVVESFGEAINYTDIPQAVQDNFTSEHTRVVIVTDEQSRPGHLRTLSRGWSTRYEEIKVDDLIPQSVPVYVWNMAGYTASILETGGANRHCFGGLNDASFGLIQLLEQGKNAPWPWMM
ncbi:TROVE domain-containing protein [Streptomyces sp. NPDC058947]|uniref:TROVE domain-containing protein n=1 Tax=Streptomyces sp. NPDC058947 TaxID=3346675 RepID=UPI0036CCFB6A